MVLEQSIETGSPCIDLEIDSSVKVEPIGVMNKKKLGRPKTRFECSVCGIVLNINEDTVYTENGEKYCEDCFNDAFFICADCGDTFESDSSHIGSDDELYCEGCFDDKFFICNECGKAFKRESGYIAFDEYYCENCYCENFTECDSCGEIISIDDSYTNGNGDGNFCSNCHDSNRINFCDNRENVINFSNSKMIINEYPSLSMFGVEIESILNCDDTDLACDETRYFSSTEDGSLSDGGVEFVSCKLPTNKDGYKIVHDFCNDFAKEYLSVDTTCGCHIHLFISPKDVTLENLKKIMCAYDRLEDFFFSMNPKSRQDNTYCKRLNKYGLQEKLYSHPNSIEEFCSILYDREIYSMRDVPHDRHHQTRYYWVNVNSIFYRNTIEIRLHSGTINSTKMINWVRIHKMLLEWLFSHSLWEVETYIDENFFMNCILDRNLRKYVHMRKDEFKTQDKIPVIYSNDNMFDMTSIHDFSSRLELLEV